MTAKIDFIQADKATEISNFNKSGSLSGGNNDFVDSNMELVAKINDVIRTSAEGGNNDTRIVLDESDLFVIGKAKGLKSFLNDCGYEVKVNILFHDYSVGYTDVDFTKDYGNYLAEGDDYDSAEFTYYISWK